MVKTSFTKAKHFYEWYVIPLNCKGKAYFCRRGNVKMKSLFWRRLYIDFHYLPLKKHGTTCSGNALLMVEVKAYEKWVTKVMSCVSVGLFPNSVFPSFLPASCGMVSILPFAYFFFQSGFERWDHALCLTCHRKHPFGQGQQDCQERRTGMWIMWVKSKEYISYPFS